MSLYPNDYINGYEFTLVSEPTMLVDSLFKMLLVYAMNACFLFLQKYFELKPIYFVNFFLSVCSLIFLYGYVPGYLRMLRLKFRTNRMCIFGENIKSYFFRSMIFLKL